MPSTFALLFLSFDLHASIKRPTLPYQLRVQGEKINSFFKARKDKDIVRTAKNISKLRQRKGPFANYMRLSTHYIRSLKKDELKTIKKCNFLSKEAKKFSHNLNLHKFAVKLTKSCYTKAFEKISKSKRINNIMKKSLRYIATTPDYAFGPEAQRELAKILSKIRSGSGISKGLNETIFSHFIRQGHYPEDELIAVLDVSDRFYSYLQKESLLGKFENGPYYKSFRKMARSLLRKNKVTKEVFHTESKKIINFLDLNKKRIRPEAASSYLFKLIRSSVVKFDLMPTGIFQFIKVNYLKEKAINDDLAFYKIWSSYRLKGPKEAYKTIKRNKYLRKFDQYHQKTQFWIAYTMEQTKKDYLARPLYSKIVGDIPLKFYPILALKRLNEISSSKKVISSFRSKVIKITNSPKIKQRGSKFPFSKDSLKRLQVWKYVGNYRLASNEIESLLDKVKESGHDARQAVFELVEHLYKKNDFLGVFKVSFQHLQREDFSSVSFLPYLFPLKYLKQVKKHSRDISPTLILSLIRQESAFNPRATSRVGARGLMQLMPATARSLSKKVSKNKLYRPNLNIRLGTKYLRRLLKKYDYGLIPTLAAYNAGEGRVRRWKKNYLDAEDPYIKIESIPFNETKNYIKFIYRNMFFYNALLSSERSLASKISL